MKKIFFYFAALLIAGTLAFNNANAQVDVSTGGPVTTYANIKLAFDAINAGTHTGAITISITGAGTYTDPAVPAVLNSTGVGAASYTSVLIRPTADGVTISGTTVTGRGVIELNAADNVTIDGDNPNTGGTNRNLTITNLAANTITYTSAVRIMSSATATFTSADNNTVKNCIINGSATGRMLSTATSTTGSENTTFGIYVGGGAGAAPTAVTSVTTNTAPSGSTVNAFLADNNSVNACARGIVFNGAAATVSSGVTVTNNTMGDQGTPSPAIPPYTSPTTTIYTKCIWLNGTSAVTVTGNAIKNIMSYVGTTTSAIELAGAIGTSVNISSNVINNVTINGASIAKGILVSSATGTYTISKNIINNTQSMGASSGTAAIDATGTVTSATIELNRITTVYNRNVGTYGASGIIFGGTAVTVKNNTISDIKMDITGGAAFSTTFGVFGIRCNAGTNHKVYHNSVNLFGAMFGTTATSILSTAFGIVGTGQTGITVYNNFFMNRLSGGTTGSTAHVGIYLPSAATVAMNLTINNNAYYCGTDATAQGIGQAGTTASAPTYLTLAALKVYTSTLSGAGTNDNASLGNTATSFAPLAGDADFHIPAGTATLLESGGISQVITGVTTDYEQPTPDVRPGPAGSIYGGAFAPDIGADEFDGINSTNVAPSISYTALGNTTSTSNRNLNGVVITDADGVNNTTFKPRIYFKKSTDPNTVAGWKNQQSTGTYDFTIDYSLIGGVSTGDIIQYFVVAQDLNAVPIVAINSGSFAASPANVALTAAAFPIGGTINQYKIVGAPLAGDYTVGVALLNRALGTNITMQRVVKKVMVEVNEPIAESISKEADNKSYNMESLISGKKVMKEIEEVSFVPMENGAPYTGPLYSKREDNPGLISDAGVGVYGTITAALTDLNDRGISASVRFLLLDASYPTETYPLTINSVSGASATNTIKILPAGGVTSTVSGNTAGPIFKLNGADYVTIDGSNNGSSSRDLTIANTNTGTSGTIVWLSSTTAPDGATNNTIKNCIITGNAPLTTFVGIVSSGSVVGTVAEAANSNNTYTNNVVSNSYYGIATVGPTGNESGTVITNNTVGTLGLIGIAIYQQQNASVSGNSITGITNASSGSAYTTCGILVSGTQDGSNISKNKIKNIKQTNTVGWGCNGIWLNASTTASNVTVSNNFISDVAAYGYLSLAGYSDNGYGIIAVTGGGYNIYYNTVSMNTSQTVDGLPAAFNVASTITTAASVNVRNNIFSNSQTVGTNRYSVYSSAANTVYADINYNDYYYGTAPNLGYLGAAQSGITQWRTATGKDVNSNSVIANFVNDATGDLHLTGASIGDINLLGTSIAGITTDIDGNARATEKPYMGADEATGLSGLTLKFNWEACPNPKTVTVQIRSSSSPYGIIEAVNGTGGGNVASTFNFGNAADATPYYVVVKSANSVETWSATPVTFTSHAANYDFTTALNQAYGSNQILSGGIPSFYQGDANQDGQVDGTDVVLTYNDASNFLTSPATDFNCDGTTDLTDILLAFGNAKNFVGVQRP